MLNVVALVQKCLVERLVTLITVDSIVHYGMLDLLQDVIKKLRKFKTLSKWRRLNGCFNSILVDLPYLESFRMLIVDTMHTNLKQS